MTSSTRVCSELKTGITEGQSAARFGLHLNAAQSATWPRQASSHIPRHSPPPSRIRIAHRRHSPTGQVRKVPHQVRSPVAVADDANTNHVAVSLLLCGSDQDDAGQHDTDSYQFLHLQGLSKEEPGTGRDHEKRDAHQHGIAAA